MAAAQRMHRSHACGSPTCRTWGLRLYRGVEEQEIVMASVHVRFRGGRVALGLLASVLAFAGGAEAESLNDIFVISMENHNFTQPSSQTSPNQIFGNPALCLPLPFAPLQIPQLHRLAEKCRADGGFCGSPSFF